MSDHPFDDPSLQTALSSYLFADNAPGLAAALREHAACVRAASVATRKLIAAVEKWSGPITYSAEVRRRYPELLRAHQETWAAACKFTLPSRHDPQVRFMLKGMWRKVFLRILLDRMRNFFFTYQFDNITFIRIFGTMRSDFHSGEFIVTDKENAVCVDISSESMQSLVAPLLPEISLNVMAKIIDINLQAVPTVECGEPLAVSDGSRLLYNYGPIDGNDVEIKVEAIREFAAALDLVRDFMLSSEKFFRTRIRDKTSTWDYIIKNEISPTAFTRAANQHRRLEVHTVEVALTRHRHALAGTAPRSKNQEPEQGQEKNRRSKRADLNQSPPSKKTPRPRREKNTP